MNKITESQEVKKEKQYNYQKKFYTDISWIRALLKCSSPVDFTQERNYIVIIYVW